MFLKKSNNTKVTLWSRYDYDYEWSSKFNPSSEDKFFALVIIFKLLSLKDERLTFFSFRASKIAPIKPINKIIEIISNGNK